MSQDTQRSLDSHSRSWSPVETSLHNSVSSPAASLTSLDQPLQDSPTIGRIQVDVEPNSSSPTGTSATRYLRKPIPSPLHTTTAVSPPSSASPTKSEFSPPAQEQQRLEVPASSLLPDPGQKQELCSSSIVWKERSNPADSGPDPEPRDDFTDSSPEQLRISRKSFGPRLSSLLPLQNHTNATRYSPELPITPNKPFAGFLKSGSPTMAGPPAAMRLEGKGAPRNSSIDSAISAISSRHSHKDSQDSTVGLPDVLHLIKTAGSPEAVIQYLLKEKQSQNTQNAQLWRLVDKQRAMILGLNKDLERALKDKEKYRKKLKESMSAAEETSSHATTRDGIPTIARVDVDASEEEQRQQQHQIVVVPVPDSPNPDLDREGPRSPIDVAMAPYPITPPADQLTCPSSAVGELLDPSHTMPKAAEHAFDKYDHEAEDRQRAQQEEEAKQAINKDLPFHVGLPPSRSLPSEPPRMPPPNPPVEASPKADTGISQFPPPPAPPPRKPPPAPLKLDKSKPEAMEEEESDSDFDSLFNADTEKRGRRRTREEDDRVRAAIAIQEAEARSLSKKSKGSKKGTPVAQEIQISPKTISPSLKNNGASASLTGVLRGNIKSQTLAAPGLGPQGLPASPRPGVGSPMNSPPLSPRGIGAFPGAPLSPRPPRAPIPLPPNTPISTPSPIKDASGLVSPRLPSTGGMGMPTIMVPPPSPSVHNLGGDNSKIFKGFVTEEYPDLLLPPNALPSIEIRVASSRMKPSRASMLSLTQLEEDPVFTMAILSRADSGELWRVEKDSASLLKLDQRLKQCSAFTAKAPDRSLFSGHSPAKLDSRRQALDHYLAEVMDTPFDTASALELCKYLSTNTLPPNADENISVEAGKESPTKTGPGGRSLRSGYLTKRGKNFGGWKARFFVLDGSQLKYYEAPGGAHLGTIKLHHAQIGKQSAPTETTLSPARTGDDENQYRHAFLILEPKKKDSSSHVKHVLCAESDKERDQWVEALLQWIDYDGDEGERPRGHNHATENDKTISRKKRGEKNRQLSDTSDTLIGMSYDSAKQGDLPSRDAVVRPKTSSGAEAFSDTLHSQISAPRDPHVISDASNWGSKVSLGVEEKKARKRSFFGFGPKTRSSSDAQDSLFDSGPPSGGHGPIQDQPRGPPRQVFGAPLADAVKYNPPIDVKVPLPAVVFRCIQYLDAKGALSEEGIFRLSGSNVAIKQLKERFNTESDVNLLKDEAYHDIHAVASLLKLYLRELPTTILTRDLHHQFQSVSEMRDHNEKIAALGELVERLPQANGTLLRYLIAFLIKVINNADRNKMTVRNVGIVFSPTLNIPAPVFAMFLQSYEAIFGINPEEYELPSPISDGESMTRPSFDRPPPRPSTATGSSSPHRQRLMEAMAERHKGDGRKGTPTPPPVLNMAASRSSPTPPMRGYEPPFKAQQSHIGLDGSHARPNPGYDRPIYEQNYAGAMNPAFNQGYSIPTSGNRRESAIFMGNIMGLNPQGSKSRLREETRF